MNRKEIWAFAEKHKISERRCYRRFLELSPEDFKIIAPHLDATRHPANRYETNYRTRENIFHLHATRHGKMYEIHNDIFNPNRYTIFTLIPHALFEGLPYLLGKIYCIFFARDQLAHFEKGWLEAVLDKNFGRQD